MEVSSLSCITSVKLELLPRGSSKHYNSGVGSFAKLPVHSHYKRQLNGANTPLSHGAPGFCRPSLHVNHKQWLNNPSGMHFASLICASALNARCGAEQTQTVEKPVSVISNAPAHNKSPQLDDGGSGFPPRDDDGDGGGGGGGGGNWSGGFFFFGFLAFLGFLKENESEGSYQDRRD